MVLAQLGEDQAGLPLALAAGVGPRRREPDEAGDVVLLVGDALPEDDAAVELGGGGRRERRPGPLGVGDPANRLGRAVDRSRLGARQLLAQEAGALGERLRVGEDDLDLLERQRGAGRSGSELTR